jgi:hypothetical protein
MPRRISYLTAHASSVGSFYAGVVIGISSRRVRQKWRTLLAGCAIGYAKNGVPSRGVRQRRWLLVHTHVGQIIRIKLEDFRMEGGCGYPRAGRYAGAMER